MQVSGGGSRVASQASGVLPAEAARRTGLAAGLSAALAPWRKPRAVHDPGKVLPDIALAVALGGDRLAGTGLLRAEPAVFGPVAPDPTAARLPPRRHSGHSRSARAHGHTTGWSEVRY
ncbi:transposase [Streptomyces roseochromogenus]|uniref:Transposase DDE domain-containing protein n=1 Tax=Streptomyces roseochromogenus subsp. oscitans DS 12.976 TaxID=1352936 RepID=V6L100_STRRC|nr:hypothetical protein M878_08525 [Streptomyces roseochromogenus subsp. oscitans DS 12.976]